MRREQQSAVRRTGEFGDDATIVDDAAPDRARQTLPSIHDAETQARPLIFDDMPTTVWTPRPKPAALVSQPRVRIRRLQRVVDEGPSVQVAPPSSAPPAAPSAARLVVRPTAPSAWDEVTRIEVRPDELRPLAEAEETAKSRVASPRRVSPVRVAAAALVLVLVALLVVVWHRKHPQGLALPAWLAARAPTSAPRNAPAATAAPPAAPTPAPSTASFPPSPTPAPSIPAEPVSLGATTAANDEFAAVEAVQSGDTRRAARLYAALALSHPTNEAYREAARILLERAKESHP